MKKSKSLRSKRSCIRFGVVGLGGMGQAHCRLISKVPKARLAAVCDSDPARSAQIGKQFGIPFFNSVAAMAASGACDAAIVATPHPLHAAAVTDCLQGELHVLCEKPITDRISTARLLVETARRKKLALAVMLQCRMDPAFQAACSLLASGCIGDLQRVDMASTDYRTQAYYDSAPWRGTWRGEGGGVLMNQAPHLLDQLVRLAGRPCKVIGRAITALHRIEVEDCAHAILHFSNGATGSIICSTVDPIQDKHLTLWGEKGVLRYRPAMPLGQRLSLDKYKFNIKQHVCSCNEVWGKLPHASRFIKIRDKPWGQATMLANMVRHLLNEEPLVCSGAEALLSLELANAISLSSWLDRPVPIPLDAGAYDRLLARRRNESPKLKHSGAVRRVTDPALQP